uniref:Uncharacterized protein n=1 Tax=Rhizophora mucronata TaxID=61149 RepID=A0A2P2K726_RHIMU
MEFTAVDCRASALEL